MSRYYWRCPACATEASTTSDKPIECPVCEVEMEDATT